MIGPHEHTASPAFPHEHAKRILVACHQITVAGGLYRFERFGRIIRRLGHYLAFVAFDEKPQRTRQTEFPVLTLQEAIDAIWDITIVPGAGFPDKTIARFAELKSSSFGLRVQHILNDVTRKSSFVRVNDAFKPHVVIFNNHHWRPGDFIELEAKAFYFLEGAVDVETLAPATERYHGEHSAPFIVGGLANKNADPLIEAVRLCGKDVHLHLFGQDDDLYQCDLLNQGRLLLRGVLNERELPSFYANISCVAHTEKYAGWANLAAEAMASGVPVICTPHGTGAFAKHETTALVISDPTPEALAQAIQRLRDEPRLATCLARNALQYIQSFSWNLYAVDLLNLMKFPETNYYTWSPDLGLFGKWPESERLAGLEMLLDGCAGKTVCDLGSGEGVIARRLLDRGAKFVHGFDREPSRVRLAARICDGSVASRFWHADLSNWTAFEIAHETHLLEKYDIVLYLGLHHHLPAATRMRSLAAAARRASRWFAVRTPSAIFMEDEIGSHLENDGFVLVNSQSDDGGASSRSYLYSRGL